MTTDQLTIAIAGMSDAELEDYAASLAVSIPSDACRERLTRDIEHKLASWDYVKTFDRTEETSIHGRQK